MRTRQFTHANVKAFVLRTLGKRYERTEGHIFEVKTIALLTGTPAPIWHVEFGLTVKGGLYHQNCVLVTQVLKRNQAWDAGKEYYLGFLKTITLPEGKESVKEEDVYVKSHEQP